MSLEEARNFFSKRNPSSNTNKKRRISPKQRIKNKIEGLEKKLMFGDLTEAQEESIMQKIGRLENKL